MTAVTCFGSAKVTWANIIYIYRKSDPKFVLPAQKASYSCMSFDVGEFPFSEEAAGFLQDLALYFYLGALQPPLFFPV